MYQRFLSLGLVPELRPDPIQSEKAGTEVQTHIPIDTYWCLEELITQLRYASVQGNSTTRLWAQFAKLMEPCIVGEKDRAWFRRNMANLDKS